jgi:hypothetical protein
MSSGLGFRFRYQILAEPADVESGEFASAKMSAIDRFVE